MGLRINSNHSAMSALRGLQDADYLQTRNISRLSTGKRTTFASDDPSGLVTSSLLKSQIGSLQKVVTAAEQGSSILATAEQSLSSVQNELENVRAAIIAANSGASSISVEQGNIDAALDNIDRVVNATRFGTKTLLNGDSSNFVKAQSAEIDTIRVDAYNYNGALSDTMSFEFVSNGTASKFSAAHLTFLSNTGSGTGTIRITGPNGTANITIGGSALTSDIRSLINDVTDQTGIYASANDMYSIDAGSDITISVELIAESDASPFDWDVGQSTGGSTVTLDDVGDSHTDTGSSPTIRYKGQSFTPGTNTMQFNSPDFTGEVVFNQTAVAGGSATVDVKNDGFTFQMSSAAGAGAVTVGFDDYSSASLGYQPRTLGGTTYGGYLASVSTGSANSLSNDIDNALRIVDAAIEQAANARGNFGSMDAALFTPAVSSLNVQIDNLSAANSTIEDLNFASEITDFTKNQVAFQAAASVLAAANQLPGTVLSLLTM